MDEKGQLWTTLLYVKSGMRKKMEAAIDVLENGCLVAEDFKAEDFKEEFYKIITEHYLRKFYCFFFFFFFPFRLDTSDTYIQPTLRINLWVGTKEWNQVYLAEKVVAKNP